MAGDSPLRIWSFGGGVQSTAALVLAANRAIDYRTFVFANVGHDAENPATLAYIERHARPFAEKYGLTIIEVKREFQDGREHTLYDHIRRADHTSLHIPVFPERGPQLKRSCTADFKIKPIAKWLKEQGATAKNPATVAIGISIDEWRRMRTGSGYDFYELDYPLVGMRIRRKLCYEIIADARLPEPPRSACWFCPFHGEKGWLRLREERPDLFAQAVALEERLTAKRRLRNPDRDPVFLRRARRPLSEVGMSDEQVESNDEDDICETGYCMT